MYLCGNSFGISFANRRESNPHSLPSGSVFCPFSTMESHHRFSTTGSNIFFLTISLTGIYETAYLKCCRSGGIRIPESPGCKPGAFNQLSYAPKTTPIFPSCCHWHLHGCIFICAVLTHYCPFRDPCALYLVNDTALTQYSQ